jgi:energy-coupling factor transporter ATP-binding protein EcfA2
MMETVHSCTTFFSNYEEREDAFRQLVDFKLARRYGGPALFWQDFSHISRTMSAPRENDRISSITSNPRDCLAFATARQVLMAALMSAGKAGDENQVSDIVSRFSIADQLSQPIRTLSGGETVKLALAKTYASIPSSSKVVISSPFSWLSSGNHHLLEDLVLETRRTGKEVSILALDGEDNLSSATSNDPFCQSDQSGLNFSIQMSEVRIPLTLSINPLAATVPNAAIDDTCLKLESPCLLTGDNGQGKSLVARALAGSLPLQGTAVIKRADGEGKASLLFQDVLIQTLLRSFDVLAEGGRGVSRSAVLDIYSKIRGEYRSALEGKETAGVPLIREPSESHHTLLDIKALLVAVRLAASPAALILDEPDWGLSRQSGIAFVSAVLSVAHRQGTPVLLISHKPWWQPLIRSCLSVSRTTALSPASPDEPVFTVSLNRRAVTR